MKFGLAPVLLLLAAVCLLLLVRRMRRGVCGRAEAVSAAVLGIAALALIGYLGATLLLVGGVK